MNYNTTKRYLNSGANYKGVGTSTMEEKPWPWLIQPTSIDEQINVPDGHHFIILNPILGSNGEVVLGNGSELYIL